MKLVFMGTPEFAVKSLDALYNAGHEILAVFTRRDKPKNRGRQLMASPVKEYAVSHGIEVYQPKSFRNGEDAEPAIEALRELSPDCTVVAAYGLILPKEVLDIPKYGCVNIHASLLPMYRGSAPIQRCIQDGNTISGVTTMFMDEGLDTGDMILKQEVTITEDMTGSELHDALAIAGGELIVKTLEEMAQGTAPRIKQEGESCFAPMISKEELKIDFNLPAEKVRNFIRAMADSPCAYTIINGKRLKVYKAELVKTEGEAGTVIDPKEFTVACKTGGLKFTEIQPEGGKRMTAMEYLRGRKLEKGIRLG